LVHSFVQDGDDADIAVTVLGPANEVPLVPGDESIDDEFGGMAFQGIRRFAMS